MAEPFLGEIRIMSFPFAPKGWALCNGQLLPINQNQALFSLLGTTYGGNGQTTFALPDLRTRVPIHMGTNHILGQAAGEKAHTLAVGELPAHTHALSANGADGTANTALGNLLAKSLANVYAAPQALVAMNPATVQPVGGGQPHENMMPFLTLNFCIALQGIFPSPD